MKRTDLIDYLRRLADTEDFGPVASALEEAADALEAIRDRREYTLARPASMPDMSGRETFTLITNATFGSAEEVDHVRRTVPAMRDTLIVSRIAPLSDWEKEDD